MEMRRWITVAAIFGLLAVGMTVGCAKAPEADATKAAPAAGKDAAPAAGKDAAPGAAPAAGAPDKK